MLKFLTVILPSIFSVNQGIAVVNSVKAEDQILNWSSNGEAHYIINEENRQFGATFTEWDLSQIGINSIEYLEDNYFRIVPMHSEEVITYPMTYFSSPRKMRVHYDSVMEWSQISNIKDIRVQSYNDFQENAFLVHSFYEIIGTVIAIEWRVMMSYYIADNDHFILQITSGFTGYIPEIIPYQFKIGFVFSPYLKLQAI